MARTIGFVIVLFVVVYLFALIILLVGTFGWFGAERDPLSGVFLIPIGLPWNRLVDLFPTVLWPWLVAASPLLNLLILYFIYRFVRNS